MKKTVALLGLGCLAVSASGTPDPLRAYLYTPVEGGIEIVQWRTALQSTTLQFGGTSASPRCAGRRPVGIYADGTAGKRSVVHAGQSEGWVRRRVVALRDRPHHHPLEEGVQRYRIGKLVVPAGTIAVLDLTALGKGETLAEVGAGTHTFAIHRAIMDGGVVAVQAEK